MSDPPSAAPSDSGPVHALRYATDGALTRYDAAVLAVRILGLYLLVQSATAWGWFVALLFSWRSNSAGVGWNDAIPFAIIPSAAYGAIGVFLLAAARWLAARLLPEAHAHDGPALAVRHAQAVALSIVGALLTTEALPNLARAAWAYYYTSTNAGSVVSTKGSSSPEVAQAVVQLVLGIWLFGGSKAIAAGWQRLRTIGVRDRDDVIPVEGEEPP
jgi:hypothetical protein